MSWLDTLRNRFTRGREDATPARAETGGEKLLETPDAASQRGDLPPTQQDALLESPPDARPEETP